METWLPVPGWSDYEVSDLGRVRSRKYGFWMIMGGQPQPGAYPRVRLSDGTRRRAFGVHQLVLLAFVGPCPPGQLVRHLNGHADDPRLVNLAYGTPSQNSYDAVRHGTHPGLDKRRRCANGHPQGADTVVHLGSRTMCRRCLVALVSGGRG